MAVTSVCALLVGGHDITCVAPVRKYYQQAAIINKSHIEEYTVTKPDEDSTECNYKVAFTLKTGTTGFLFRGPEAGSNYFGSFDKSRSDLGFAQYKHNVQVLITGVSEEVKCILDSFDKGSYVVALQLKDGTVEIYGLVNGLTTGDYTYNIQEGGGGTPIMLSSDDNSPEGSLPLIYESTVPGSEGTDFDDLFAVA